MTTTKDKLNHSTMVITCVVPGRGSRSDRDHRLSFHLLPLKNKILLKKWLHQIGRKNVPLNNNSRVCSKHFKQLHKRTLRGDEFPTENLPVTNTSLNTHSEKTTGTPPIIQRKGKRMMVVMKGKPTMTSMVRGRYLQSTHLKGQIYRNVGLQCYHWSWKMAQLSRYL